MSSSHTVVQGEYLSSIARKYSFSSHQIIWSHPQNAALKRLRQNPNVLLPGDQLVIPDRTQKEAAGSTGQRHRFVIHTEPLKLRLTLSDHYEKPIANAECQLVIDDEPVKMKTDGDGKIERDIRPGTKDILVTIVDPQTPIGDLATPIKIMIGHLDPVDSESGQRARLSNLGYLIRPVEGESEREALANMLSAIEEFQCDHGLTVDGRCGPATQAKLKAVHGC